MRIRQKTQYVFGAALAGVAMGGIPGLMDRAHAAVVTNADFTFESITAPGAVFSATGTITATAGQLFGTYGADSGTGTAYGMHASTSAYSAPTGNGSSHSLSSNDWAVGDYYQFSVPTTGIQNIQIAFDQISSGSGPAVFDLVASSNGSAFSTVATYSIVFPTATGTGTTTSTSPNSTATITGTQTFWGANTYQTYYNQTFNLSGLTALNNDAGAVFEIVDISTAAFSSAAGVQTSGSDRVDNFVVSGTTVPEPAALSLLTVAAAGLMSRRRSS
jgi:hypothetical protein